ncbi:transglutaminase domain-containing protein [Pseudoneobacillus sp. C159]
MKRKWMIFIVTISFLIGGLQASPVLASKGNWTLSLLEKVSLYRSNQHFGLTNFVQSVISFSDKSEYLLPSALVQNNHPEIIQLAREITAGLKTDKEKSMAIFLWVTSNIEYDAKGYFKDPENPRYYSSLETLRTKVALCSGYAHLNAALHRAVGIESKVVYGEGHAWNEVKISGSWQEQDPTYGSGGLNMVKKTFVPQVNMEYFSSADLQKEGVFPW